MDIDIHITVVGRAACFDAHVDGECRGYLMMLTDGHYVERVQVDEEYRRKGIATALYNKAEEYFGRKLRPSLEQSDDARAFWRDRQCEARDSLPV